MHDFYLVSTQFNDLLAWKANGYKHADYWIRVAGWNLNRARILRNLPSARALSFILDEPFDALETVVNQPTYHTFTLPKKRGGVRHIQSPDADLKRVQRKLKHWLDDYYSLIRPPAVHGFVKKLPGKRAMSYGIRSNAEPHVGKYCVLNIDIQDFFSSISSERVYALFKSNAFDYPDNLAKGLTKLCTYEGKLPTGAPTSPVISNFICLRLDDLLTQFAQRNGLTYTRYADDLTFSGDTWMNDDCIQDIRDYLEHEGFRINPSKIRRQGRGSRQMVTGLVVNDKVNYPRKKRKLLRAILHDMEVNGIEAAAQRHLGLERAPTGEEVEDFRCQLEGMKGYIRMIERN